MVANDEQLRILEKVKTNEGRCVLKISEEKPVLLVFLRHFGCIYCRKAMKDLSKLTPEFQSNNVKLVCVHMTNNQLAEKYFKEYGLEGVEHISDPETKLYAGFGIQKGSFKQLFGLKNWIKGFEAVAEGNMVGLKQIGDGFQMPGLFVIHKNKIVERFIHQYASDIPDYRHMIKCCNN